MTISIPAGTVLTDEQGRAMTVCDASSADITDFDIAADLYTVKFEDGEEYTVTRGALMAPTAIHINPGNNIISRNGVSQPGSVRDHEEQS